MYALVGFGAAQAAIDASYADKAVGIITQIANDPIEQKKLDSLTRATIDVANIALNAMPPGNAAGMLTDAMGSMAAGAAAGAAEAIPLIGAGVKVITAMIDVFNAINAKSEDDFVKSCFASCATSLKGTGSDGRVLPANIFAASVQQKLMYAYDVHGKKIGSSASEPIYTPSCLGAALIAITESVGDVAVVRKALGKPSLGIPEADRKMFKKLRQAIQSSLRHRTSTGAWTAPTDGGVELWPIYMAKLYEAFRNGRMDWNYARYLYVYDEARNWLQLSEDTARFYAVFGLDEDSIRNLPGAPSVSWGGGAAGTGPHFCARYDTRPLSMIYELVRRWGLTVNPQYEPDISIRNAELARLSKIRADLLREKKPGAKPAAEPSPLLALAAGAAVAGGVALLVAGLRARGA